MPIWDHTVDLTPEENWATPTCGILGACVIHGEDILDGPADKTEFYQLTIKHVRFCGPSGQTLKGFMPTISSLLSKDVGQNGGAHEGTGCVAYDKAIKEGREILAYRQRHVKEVLEALGKHIPDKPLLPLEGGA